jgi:superfamily I DNA/RNA helicase
MDAQTQGSTSDESLQRARRTRAKHDRQKHVAAVLGSPSSKKVVVGGPGTGKTYLFKKLLEGKGNTLTLTFVNALVEDLSLELCGLSDVRTLHSFALSVLKKAKKKQPEKRQPRVFPKLTQIISEDAKILLDDTVDFADLFHNRDDQNPHLVFYKERKDYYAYYGFSDIVFALVRYFEENRSKIPTFDQVVVDEFQDFNTLEVSLIDLLAKKSPILLAGDDDQALYESLKSASPHHIRQRYSIDDSNYEAFNLPWCSRSTRVIVEATNDVIRGAQREGHLNTRIDKPFRYFDDEVKDLVSSNNPWLIYTQVQPRQIPWFIQKQIEQVAVEVKGKFTVLIISPTRTQSRLTADALKAKGFKDVQRLPKQTVREATFLDGLKLLLEDAECNLGWRIVARAFLDDEDFQSVLKRTHGAGATPFLELVDRDLRREVRHMLTALRAVKSGRQANKEKLAALLDRVNLDVYQMAQDYLREDIESDTPVEASPEVRKTPLIATTIQSSKGLAADYVFITHFDDRYLVRDKDKSRPSDQDICAFLVALTRARKKVFLVSSDTKKKPKFLGWISPQRIENVTGQVIS